MRIIKSTILIFVLLFTFNSGTKGQTFDCFITNDTLLDPTTYQFDIFLIATSTDFNFRNIQVGIQFDSTFFPVGGTITPSVVPGSTQLPLYTSGPPFINYSVSCFCVPSSSSGTCVGSPGPNSMLFTTALGPKRIATYRLSSTFPFNNVAARPSMIRLSDPAPAAGVLKMALSKWSPTCIATTITANGTYTNYNAGTLINIHNPSLYVPYVPNVVGDVYYDINSNCQRDSFETGLSNVSISSPPGYYTSSNSSGNFYFMLPDGTYQLQCSTPVHWTVPCSSNNFTITNGIASSIPGFGLRPIPGINDLSMNFSHPSVRANRDASVIIHYRNEGTTTLNGTIHFDMDTIFTFVSSTTTPDTILPHSLSWNFTNLLMGESRQIQFVIHSGMYPTNTPFTNSAYVWAMAGDVELNDNSYSITDALRGSFDPNEKYISPKGYGLDGAITPIDSILNYRIAFQNTGNDTAFYVMVVDSIDESLDPMTIRIGAVNMPYTYSLSSTGVMKFVFDPCALPDSSTDEAHSHGLINYSIHTRPNLPNGTVIQNTAHIYFDYNLPIATNTTVNTIDYFLSNKEINSAGGIINVYPNPSTGLVHVSIGKNNSTESFHSKNHLVISNLMGQTIKEIFQSENDFVLDLSNEPGGVYFISVFTGKESIKTKVVKE